MELKVLCVHGVGQHPNGGPWEGAWRDSIQLPLARLDPSVTPVIEFVYLDDIFDQFKISFVDVLEALAKLGTSALVSPFRQPKGLGDSIRWTAGMVVQWVENDKLRRLTRERLAEGIARFDPHMVIGHSLGSLVCYDTFTTGNGAELVTRRRFVSAGSQIGNPFVMGNFAAGRLTPLRTADFWYHLYNKEDDVFTAEVKMSATNFAQVDTQFDIEGLADHDVTEYMGHGKTANTVWADVVMALHGQAIPRRFEPTTKELARINKGPAKWATKPTRRALLVGINEYPDPSQNLEGCVNDVFLVSSLLQERGFAAEDIRIVLNDRATCSSVIDRLDWLLDGAAPGDTRFFYYSGHGAQVPQYGLGERIDLIQESLVLHDFDWSAGRAFTDAQFHALYSQLPYELRFVAMFDCCHSGGMTRAGGRRIRGMDPPDDVRHRMLRWDAKREMWVPRDFKSPAPQFDRKFNGGTNEGHSRSTHRLGQAMSLRAFDNDQLKAAAQERGHMGPYLPVLIYASRADQFSFEYQHGAIAHGAFTFCLVKALRNDRRKKGSHMTFEQLMATVRDELSELGYDQAPQLVAPSDARNAEVPLRA